MFALCVGRISRRTDCRKRLTTDVFFIYTGVVKIKEFV